MVEKNQGNQGGEQRAEKIVSEENNYEDELNNSGVENSIQQFGIE